MKIILRKAILYAIFILLFLLLFYLLTVDVYYKTHSTLNPLGFDLMFVGIGIAIALGVSLGILAYGKTSENIYEKIGVKHIFAVVVFFIIATVCSLRWLMECYTNQFGVALPPIKAKVIEVRYSSGRGSSYHIKTDKFGNWRVSSQLYHSVNLDDTLIIYQKESIFMTAIYEKEIRNMSNSGQ